MLLIEKESNTSLWQSLSRGPFKVLVIGGGNWGTVISRVAADNVTKSYIFDSTLHMWLQEEFFDNKPLTEIINTKHENVKYLPGYELPKNLVAVSNLIQYASVADLLVFVIPHQFVDSTCQILKHHVKRTAHAISLLKGIKVVNGQPVLYSSIISEALGIPCSVMSGANVANDIAQKFFSESTLGYKIEQREAAAVWQQLFDTDYLKITGVPDVCGVEVCGALKNIVALAAGFCDALNFKTNTKAAFIRIGVEEIKLFATLFFDNVSEETFFDSAGYADVITTCFGGRNVRCAAEFIRRGGKDSWEKIEQDLLNGQKMQGQLTAKEIHQVISVNKLEKLFPLLHTTYLIAYENMSANQLITTFGNDRLRPLKNSEDCNKCLIPEFIKNRRRFLSNLSNPDTSSN